MKSVEILLGDFTGRPSRSLLRLILESFETYIRILRRNQKSIDTAFEELGKTPARLLYRNPSEDYCRLI